MPDSLNPEPETIDGFDIPSRELSEEEANREITWERIRDFHYEVGEDFIDQTGYVNEELFAGWLLHKYPEHSLDILDVCNARHSIFFELSELDFLSHDEEKDIEKIYIDYAEFCNQTKHLKRRVNTVLIIVMETYEQQ